MKKQSYMKNKAGIILISLMVLTSLVSCGAFKRKEKPTPTPNKVVEKTASELKSEKEKSLQKKLAEKNKTRDEEEDYYGQYIPVNRTNMPYKERVASYIEEFSGVAMKEMREYKIPASITLAQGILESGAGTGVLAMKSNNHFGIKCHDWTGKSVSHDDDAKGECFRKYKHPEASYKDHSKFLTTRSRYATLFTYDIGDYVSWAKGLRKAGYATDPRYPDKLIRIIRTYKLNVFDKYVLGKADSSEIGSRSKAEAEEKIEGGYTQTDYKEQRSRSTSTRNQYPSTSTTTGSQYPIRYKKIDTSNAKKVHMVKPKETLYSLSKKYDVSMDDLIRYNQIKGTDIYIDQVLIIEP